MHRVARPNFVSLLLVSAAFAFPLAVMAQDRPGPVLPPPSLYDDAPPSAQTAPVTTAPSVERDPESAQPAPPPRTAPRPAPVPAAQTSPPPRAAVPASAPAKPTSTSEAPWYQRTWQSITGWFGDDSPSEPTAAREPKAATPSPAMPAKSKVGTSSKSCESFGRGTPTQLQTCVQAPAKTQMAVAPLPQSKPTKEPVQVTPIPAPQLKAERAMAPEPAPEVVARTAPSIPPAAPLAAEPVSPPPVQVHTLSADALFAFGSHELKPSARTALDELVARLKEVTFKQIKVTGHTDPIGSVAFNDRLALKRAQTVKRYLEQHGVVAERIEAEGAGSSMPMVIERDCAKLPREKKIACYQPDRRVEIEVTEAVEKTAAQ